MLEFLKSYVSGSFVLAAAIAGALLALVGVAITNFFSARNNNKNLFIGTVTRERATWRSELRNQIASFCKTAHEHSASSATSFAPALHEARVHILLRLNPNPEHALDAGLIAAVANAMQALHTNDSVALEAALTTVEKNAQALLKQEWDKSKREAVSGKVETV